MTLKEKIKKLLEVKQDKKTKLLNCFHKQETYKRILAVPSVCLFHKAKAAAFKGLTDNDTGA